MVNSQSSKKNQKEAIKLLDILGKCNAWTSCIKTDVPIGRQECNKIESQMIHQNHIELSKVIETRSKNSFFFKIFIYLFVFLAT